MVTLKIFMQFRYKAGSGSVDPYYIRSKYNGVIHKTTNLAQSASGTWTDSWSQTGVNIGDTFTMETQADITNSQPTGNYVMTGSVRTYGNAGDAEFFLYPIGFRTSPITRTIDGTEWGYQGGSPTYLEELHKLDRPNTASHYQPL